MKRLSILALMSAAMIMGCGQTEEEREQNGLDKPETLEGYEGKEQSATFEQYSEDAELVSANIMSSNDEVLSSLADGDTTYADAASLALVEAEAKVTRERSCEKPEDDVIVSIKRGMERTVTREGLRRTLERYFKFSSEITRTWSNDNNDLACHSEGKHVDFAAIDFNSNVKLTAQFTREKSQWSKLTNRRTGTEYTTQLAFNSAGTRMLSWGGMSEDEDAGTKTYERSVTVDIERNFDVQKADGQAFSFSNSIKTADDAPLIQEIVRDAETLVAVKRTIKSGKLINTRKDESYLTTEFADVVYEKDNHCLPVSGKISGALFKKDSEEAVRSYVIEFSEADATITFANGESYEYAPEGCELEDIELNEQAEVAADEGAASDDSETAAE